MKVSNLPWYSLCVFYNSTTEEGLYPIRLAFYFSRHLKFILKQFYLYYSLLPHVPLLCILQVWLASFQDKFEYSKFEREQSKSNWNKVCYFELKIFSSNSSLLKILVLCCLWSCITSWSRFDQGCGKDDRVVRSLNPWSKGCKFEPQSIPVTKSVRRVCATPWTRVVLPGKTAKGITRCGHIERKDQGRTA